MDFADLVGKLNACSWFFVVFLLLIVAGPMLMDGIQGSARFLYCAPTTKCDTLAGFIISMLLLVPTFAMLKGYSSTPVHREIGINSVVQCSSPRTLNRILILQLRHHCCIVITSRPVGVTATL